ncbi:alpha/beta-hydrolase family protein [Nesterenkonia sp. DZ6]|uniref:alpha/beta-hydrolase family protein n=1 Tax=Nesterenkonia sp. DZ6 TaxID=2901229 RepID=UPI001F4CB843|nr:alpha/beta-hydrolase family protein [Nesterenkonia sp. DZ6]MCH8560983.1 alpha/beta hydrolase [Nesterenkonia sp. DZ6]
MMSLAARCAGFLRAHLINLVCALALASLALTPSLVPRPTVFQGVMAGLWFMVGFQLGFAVRRGGRALARRFGKQRFDDQRVGDQLPGSQPTRRGVASSHARRAPRPGGAPPSAGMQQRSPRRTVRLTGALVVALLAYVVGYGALVVSWQNEVRELVEMEPVDGAGHVAFVASMVVTMGLLLGIARGITALRSAVGRWVVRRSGSERRGRWASRATGVTAVLALILGLVGGGLGVVGQVYHDRDAGTLEGSSPPVLPGRSGGPGSAAEWDGLGRQGRAFAGGGPSAAQIAQVTGAEAEEPVRAYAGLSQGEDPAARAALVVEELERHGGFDREVLLVATPTGSGWLEPQAIASLEHLYAGDTATASMQYSVQPSWVPFLFDPDLPKDSSRALFDAVHARWQELPEADRPRLVVYGLSLGALGMSGSFLSLEDLLARTDAALFTGPPATSEPWRTLQANRDPGSPIWRPVYRDGEQVRWQSKPGDFAALGGSWRQPRLGYLQHATDPITWLDPAVIVRSPEWLQGPAASGGRGADVSDSMRWIPGVTFLHLVADMLVSEAVPPSHGHNFGDVAVDGWAQVLPGHGRSQEQLDAIQSVIEQIDTHDPTWE